jgi:hypothetical protein
MAAAQGAQTGVKLAVAVGAMVLAFVALVALANGLLGGIGHLFGVEGLSFQWILGKIFQPIMFMLNVPWDEAGTAGGLFGTKVVLNEFVAFIDLAQSARAFADDVAITTFMLCGFANFSSITFDSGHRRPCPQPAAGVAARPQGPARRLAVEPDERGPGRPHPRRDRDGDLPPLARRQRVGRVGPAATAAFAPPGQRASGAAANTAAPEPCAGRFQGGHWIPAPEPLNSAMSTIAPPARRLRLPRRVGSRPHRRLEQLGGSFSATVSSSRITASRPT